MDDERPATFEQQVNEVVAKFIIDDTGNTVIPKDLKVSEEVMFAATAIKRQRDTQAAYTRTRQNELQYEAQAKELKAKLAATTTASLTTDQQTELEILKVNDPDAWRAKLGQYEADAEAALQQTINDIEAKGTAAGAVAQREQLTAAYTERYGVELTDELIESSLPSGYIKELEAGTTTFEDFLDKSYKFLTAAKVINQGEPVPATRDMSTLGGEADTGQQTADGDYENDTY